MNWWIVGYLVGGMGTCWATMWLMAHEPMGTYETYALRTGRLLRWGIVAGMFWPASLPLFALACVAQSLTRKHAGGRDAE